MGKFVVAFSFLFLAGNPTVTLGQQIPAQTANEQRRAGALADLFIQRFRETLDFGIVWKEFRLSDPSCTQRANGILNESGYQRLKLSRKTVEKLYIATMNYYYLIGVYDLSMARIDDHSPDESPEPPGVKAIKKASKFFQDDDHQLKNAEDVNELIGTLDRLARQYRKHLPKGVMKSQAWRANQKRLIAGSGTGHPDVANGNSTFCISEQTKVYLIDRGMFYFYIIKEGRRMRVAGLGIE